MQDINKTNIIDVVDSELLNGQRAIMIETSNGNIVLPVGVGSFVAGGKVFVEAQKTITNEESTEVVIDVSDNTRYEFTQPLVTLTINSIPLTGLASTLIFTAGVGFKLSIPETVSTIGDLLSGVDLFAAGKKYVISCSYNEVIAYSFNDGV